MAAGQREGVAVGARGPRAAESALGPRALGEFPWSKVPTYNLAHDLSYDPARDPAEGGGDCVAVVVWQWPCGGHMTCHVTWQDNPLRVTII